jgi:serine/threonine-protein kinase HipA
MTETGKSLDVFFEDDLVGHVYDTSPLSFEYASQWIQRRAIQIANIKLAAGKSDDASVSAFFENLLPEGQLRTLLLSAKKASTLFGLLHAVAGDTAGGFVLLPTGQKPQPPSYQPTSWSELATELRTKSASAINLKGAGTRISLAGAQDKATIALFGDGVPRLGVGTSPSTHILKPDIRNIDGVWASAVNETLMMKTALGCGLEAATVFYEPTTRACVVERFDRFLKPDGNVGRIMQYDLCQLSSLPSEKKYEAEGGPSLKDCADLIRRYCSVPAIDLKRLIAWVFFNIFTGNNDSHAKNLSLFRPAVGGVRLTPFYDLMCTRIYPGLSQNFAFNIGGTTIPGEMEQRHISAMAEQLNMRPKYVLGIGQKIAKQLPLALASAAASMQDALQPGDVTMAKRLNFYVVKTAKQASKRMQLGV